MKVIIVKPNVPAYAEEVKNELKELQEIVGGYLEVVPLLPGAVIVCNEEGKLKGLEPNLLVGGDIIHGTFFICNIDGEEFASLTEKQATDYIAVLNAKYNKNKE